MTTSSLTLKKACELIGSNSSFLKDRFYPGLQEFPLWLSGDFCYISGVISYPDESTSSVLVSYGQGLSEVCEIPLCDLFSELATADSRRFDAV